MGMSVIIVLVGIISGFFRWMPIGAENMVYNPGLERWANPDLPDGWTTSPRPEKETVGLCMPDENEKYEGRRSLKVVISEKTKGTRVAASAFIPAPQKDQTYTFSAYLKADRENQEAVLQITSPNFSKPIILTKTWQRYWITFTPVQDPRYMECGIKFINPGTYWIDAVQLEKGETATDYVSRDVSVARAEKETVDVSIPKIVPEYRIVPTVTAPRIDGRLDDPCWQKAQKISFPLRKGEGNEKEITEAMFCADDNSFYVGVICYESGSKLKAEVTRRDGEVWTDDCIELFVNPSGDLRTYYHFAVNAIGTMYDARHLDNVHNRDVNWDADWKAAVARGIGLWTVEIAIPYYIFPANELNNIWRVNIGRERPISKEYACWFGKFHNPRTFPKVVNIPVKKEEYGVIVKWQGIVEDKQRLGELALLLLIDGTGMKKSSYPKNIRVKTSFSQNEVFCDDAEVVLSAGEKQQISLPIIGGKRLKEDTLCQITLMDSKKSKIVYRTPWINVSRGLFLFPSENGGPNLSYYTTEGSMKFIVRKSIDKEEAKDAKVFLRISDLTGKTIFESKPQPFKQMETEIIIDIKNLPVGTYIGRGIVIVGGKERLCEEYEIKKLPPLEKGIEVKIDRYARCLLRDGKPYLPIGVGVSSYHFNEYGVKGVLDKVVEWGFVNTILVWRWTDVSKGLYPERLEEILNEAYARNLTVSVVLQSCIAPGGKVLTDPEKIREILEFIKRFRNHPALLSWYIFDEPVLVKEETKKFYNLVKEADPYHPVWLNGYDIGNLKTHLESTDIDSITYYPVPIRPVSSVTMVARELGRCTSWRPIHMWIQAWGARSYDCYREPSVQELTSMVYQALVSNVKAITYYTENLRPNSYILLQHLASIKKEIDTLSQVILTSLPARQPKILSSDVEGIMKFADNKWWIISVNKSETPTEATFILPDEIHTDKVQVLFESRQIKVENGKFKDKFAPFERHIYQLE